MHFSAWSAVYKDGGEPPLKPSAPTCYKEFGTNSIIVLMFVQGPEEIPDDFAKEL
jgi:hypothetical protein